MIQINYDPMTKTYTAEFDGAIVDYSPSLYTLCKSLSSQAAELDERIKEGYDD